MMLASSKKTGPSGAKGHSIKINAVIIRTFETGNLNKLLIMIEHNLPSMNLVNLSTALNRLAKLTAKDTKGSAWIPSSCFERYLVCAAFHVQFC